MIFLYVFVDNDGDLCESEHVLCGNKSKVCVSLEVLNSCKHLLVVVSLLTNLEDKLGEVEGLNVDTVSLESNLVETNGLERSCSCTDATEVESLHTLNNAADSSEVVKVLTELGCKRINNVGLKNGEGDLILIENVSYRELTAVSIAAVLEVHLADGIGISLHKDRNTCILKSGNCAVLVDEYRHAEDNSVILALVGLEPIVVESTLVASLNCAVAGSILVHNEIVVACVGNSLYHVLACALNELCGHKAAVSEIQCKCLLFHNKISFVL